MRPPRRVPRRDDARGRVLRGRTEALSGRATRSPSRAPSGLAFTHHLGYGGGQLYLSELLEKMAAGRDFPCTVVAPFDGPLRRILEGSGLSIHITSGYPLGSPDEYEGKVAELVAYTRMCGATHILVNSLPSFIGADVGMRLGLPVVWAIHESFPLPLFWMAGYPEDLPHPYIRVRAQQALQAASALVFEAEATRELFSSLVGKDRSRVVPYGIDNAAIDRYRDRVTKQAARRRLGLSGGSRVVLCMGTIEPRKCQTLLVEAFARTAPSLQQPVVLALVGDLMTPYSRALKEFVAWSGLKDRVLVEPVVTDTNVWYRASDALISAADVESMPRSLLEAMAFGLPVAASAVFGVPELITHGETGLVFETRCRSALEVALTQLLTMPATDLLAMGERGRALVRERHDSSQYASVYRSMIGL